MSLADKDATIAQMVQEINKLNSKLWVMEHQCRDTDAKIKGLNNKLEKSRCTIDDFVRMYRGVCARNKDFTILHNALFNIYRNYMDFKFTRVVNPNEY